MKMNEEEKETAQEKPEDTVKDTPEGDKPESTRLIDDANLAAKRLEEANKERSALLIKEEELMAKKALSGNAEAGQETPKKKELTDVEFSNSLIEQGVNLFKDK